MYKPVFASAAMKALVSTCDKLASSSIPVLLCGETGTGKEVIARHIHENSPRARKPFVPVNCAALPAELVESELFGSVRGAFTDAKKDRPGLIGAAHEGTLFLDELNEMPISMQSKLLRTLQDKKIRRVGSVEETDVDFRLVCAVSRIPKDLVEEKRLRPDLYYRIGAVTLYIPRLKNRKVDILPMAETFLEYYAQELKVERAYLGSDAKEALLNYDWPGNVRQLENEIQRVLALGYKGRLPPEGFSPNVLGAPVPEDLSHLTLIEQTERQAIVNAIRDVGKNGKEVAKHLGIGRQTLYNKIKRYNLEAVFGKKTRQAKPETGPQQPDGESATADPEPSPPSLLAY
jgi:transcriptional regulator with PAS, ATPase and Fis domain